MVVFRGIEPQVQALLPSDVGTAVAVDVGLENVWGAGPNSEELQVEFVVMLWVKILIRGLSNSNNND